MLMKSFIGADSVDWRLAVNKQMSWLDNRWPTEYLLIVWLIAESTDFFNSVQDAFSPIIFGRPFLHTVGAEISLPKERVFIKCVGEIL
jgi:hypothetical protein